MKFGRGLGGGDRPEGEHVNGMRKTRVDEAFAALDESLNLDPLERKKAEERHNEVREVLKAAGLISGAFLQGSFARKTMLAPLKDIDTVNLLVERLREQLRSPGGVQRAFDLFQNAVQEEWRDAVFDRGDEPPAAKALRCRFQTATSPSTW